MTDNEKAAMVIDGMASGVQLKNAEIEVLQKQLAAAHGELAKVRAELAGALALQRMAPPAADVAAEIATVHKQTDATRAASAAGSRK